MVGDPPSASSTFPKMIENMGNVAPEAALPGCMDQLCTQATRRWDAYPVHSLEHVMCTVWT